ncbi:MAG TPA: 3-isopropylmalate dehydratase small subunit [Vicinamibacteria bacterium]|jgi:3-isopropylmalate/(R)-2-methylmalate dehydratase small subunit|nr:3-isopropylmalate dehydratase small subunit [Vicinamibacteria bacterium]
MEPFRALTSRVVVLDAENIDTDQICPARFLTSTTRGGFGTALFADWRLDGQGRPRPEFALNRPEAEGARVLVAGRNFGCGSSREHAVWALQENGFRAVVSTSFADIFRSNALKAGLLPVQVDPITYQKVAAPPREVTIDLKDQTLRLPDGSVAVFPIEPFARHCLLEGADALSFLLSQEAAIAAHEQSHGSPPGGPAS